MRAARRLIARAVVDGIKFRVDGLHPGRYVLAARQTRDLACVAKSDHSMSKSKKTRPSTAPGIKWGTTSAPKLQTAGRA